MLGLPIMAIAALVLVLTLGNGGGSKKVEATQGAANTVSLSIGSCTGPKCDVPIGDPFTVSANLVTWTAAYDGFSIVINSSVGAPKSGNCNAWKVPAGGGAGAFDLSAVLSATQVAIDCAKQASTPTHPDSTMKGKIGEAVINCTQSGALSIDAASTLVVGGSAEALTGASLNVNCVEPTNTPTATATSTPLPGIQMQKCYGEVNNHTGKAFVKGTFGNQCIQSANLFLTNRNPAQSNTDFSVVPPNPCGVGEGVVLHEGLSNMPPNTTTKGEEGLGAFQFEVRYDSKAVCVEIKALQAGGLCSTLGGTKGIIRFGCVTLGKTKIYTGPNLAEITVRVTKETVQQIRPGQSNGVALQILNQDCQLADLQGIEIAILSCEDADLSIRFLEGDVVPNCAVDTADTGNIAMRWGALKGGQLFQAFKDLSPSGHGLNGDGRIDIQDLQFVYGRYGSTCNGAYQWPPQPPFTDKKK